MKVWKLVLGMHILLAASLILWTVNLPEADHIYTKESPAPVYLDIGFVLC